MYKISIVLPTLSNTTKLPATNGQIEITRAVRTNNLTSLNLRRSLWMTYSNRFRDQSSQEPKVIMKVQLSTSFGQN
ncbi:hypothetical protein D3C75_744180 [compost metagenome]